MSEKKNIETTRLVMENWNRYLDEGWLDKLKQPFVNKSKETYKQIFGDEGTSDIEIDDKDIEQEEPVRQYELQISHGIMFLNNYLNYDKFRVDIVKMVRNQLRDALDRAVRAQRGPEPGDILSQVPEPVQLPRVPEPVQLPEQDSFDEGQREAIYRKVSNVVLDRVELAIKKALPPSAKDLVISDLKESLNSQLLPVLVEVCRKEDKKMLTESKKISIKIGG